MSTELLAAIISVIAGAFAGLLAYMLTLGKYQERIESITQRIGKLEDEVKTTHHELIECRTKLEERTSSSPSKYVRSKSPMALTDAGESLLSRTNGQKFVLDNKDELIESIKKQNPKTAYDIQEASRKAIESMQNEDRFIPFKNFAFKEGLTLDVIFLVLGIYLRDIALPILGYNLDDIDKTNPAKIDRSYQKV